MPKCPLPMLPIFLICVVTFGCTQPKPTSITERATEEPPPSATVKLSPGEKLATSRVESAVTANAQLTARALTPTTTPRPPTITPTPSLTPTATPSVPLSAEGHWLLFRATVGSSAEQALWAINQDATGLTELIDETVLICSAQPVQSLKDGLLIAYVTQPEAESRDLQLKILHWPSREIETVARLINDTGGAEGINLWDARVALDIAWTHDGERFAFTGQIDGPTMDAYVYDLGNKSIVRLSSGNGQAFRLRWSPDERWLIHEAFYMQGMAGPESSGIWAAWADGSGSITIFDQSKMPDDYSSAYVYRWIDATHLILISRPYKQDNLIQNYDVNTGRAQTIVSTEFESYAYSLEQDTWLLTPYYMPDQILPLKMYRDGKMVEIPSKPLWQMWWRPDIDAFLGFSRDDNKLYSISLSGEVTEVPIVPAWELTWAPSIDASPDGTLWAWWNYVFYDYASELWIGPPMQKPVLVAGIDPPNYTDNILWSPDSQRLFMSTNKGLYVGQRPDFKPVPVVRSTNDGYWAGRFVGWIP